MSNVSLIEQLDEAIEALLVNPDAPHTAVDARADELLSVAAELRHLPRASFKASLKAELERRATMTRSAVKPIREGFHTITPYIIVEKATELIDFVKQAFGAEELYRGIGSAGGIHCEVKIGDSIVMMGGGETLKHRATPTGIHLYVKDTDAVYASAIEAGATSLGAPVDQPYGDREASVKDASGNHWYIATHQATGHKPEGLRSVTTFLHPHGAPQLIEFLERAFGAEQVSRDESPDGIIHHATVKIGDSMIEMGEAHGPWQPMPTTFFLYVDDVDAWYRRAVEAGAASQSEPADQPYGDRLAGVTDPFDNVWYLATHISDVSM
jgi:PhnB protein